MSSCERLSSNELLSSNKSLSSNVDTRREGIMEYRVAPWLEFGEGEKRVCSTTDQIAFHFRLSIGQRRREGC